MPWSGHGLKLENPQSLLTQGRQSPPSGNGSHSPPMGHVGDTSTMGVPRLLYRQACVTTVQEALKSSDEIGYPVMIKASEGGGGKGIRKATDAASLPNLFCQVQTEVPGSPIFIMKLAEK